MNNTGEINFNEVLKVYERRKYNEKKKSNKGKKLFYVLGGITTTVCAFIAVPKIINKLSNKMYNPMPFIDDTEEDWGPEIVKREKKENEILEGEE